MLDLAINHESELSRAFLNTVMDLRYQYFNGAHYWELYEAEKKITLACKNMRRLMRMATS